MRGRGFHASPEDQKENSYHCQDSPPQPVMEDEWQEIQLLTKL